MVGIIGGCGISIEALTNKLPAYSNDSLVEIGIGRNVGGLGLDAITLIDTLFGDILCNFYTFGLIFRILIYAKAERRWQEY